MRIFANPIEAVKEVERDIVCDNANIVKFFSLINKTNYCWEWKGNKNSTGYGRLDIFIKGKHFRPFAHRISWIVYFGDIPENKLVCHRCDNRLCINPDHLFLASQSDNIKDMYKKGRASMNKARGEKHHFSKLTKENVIEIRKKANDGLNYGDVVKMSKEFKIARRNIHKIISRENWRIV